MPTRFRQTSRLLSPLLCLGMLGFVAAEQRGYPKPEAFEPFHAHVKQQIDSIPLSVGPWMGSDVKVPESARALLRPNALRNVRYQNIDAYAGRAWGQGVYLVVVQCQRSIDMFGHFPPNCYPAFGDVLIAPESKPRDWNINGLTITGMQYVFERNISGRLHRRTVYNFMVVPERGIVRDMKQLVGATEDQGQRYYGAAQIQVVFASEIGQEPSASERDAVFETLINAAWPAIDAILAGRTSLTDATNMTDAIHQRDSMTPETDRSLTTD